MAYCGFMKSTELRPGALKAWMKDNEKTVAYVSDQTHVSYRTLERFLAGGHDLSLLAAEAIRRLIEPGAIERE